MINDFLTPVPWRQIRRAALRGGLAIGLAGALVAAWLAWEASRDGFETGVLVERVRRVQEQLNGKSTEV